MLTADTTKSTSGVYTCQTCNSLFTCLDYYQQHRKNHAEAEGVKLLTCAHCTYVSDNAFHFNWHIMSHASSAPHRCEVCTPLQFTNQTSTNCNGDLVNGGDGSGVGGNGSNGFGSTGTGTRISDPIVGFGKRSIATDTNDDLISYSSPSYQSSASSSASSTTNSSKSTTAITTRREDIYTNLQTIDASDLLDDTTKNDIDNDDDCNNDDNCDNNNEQQNILLQVQQAYSETNEDEEDEDESEDSDDDDEESESEQQYDDTNFAQQHSNTAADSFKDFEEDDNTLKSDSNLILASIEQQLSSPNIKLELDEEDEEEVAMENNEYGDNQSRELVMDTIHQDEVGQDFEEGVGDEQQTEILNSNDYESQQEQIADEYEDSVYDGGDDGNATTTADDEDCNELTSVTSLKPVQSDATTIDDVYEFTSDDEHIESVSMIPRCLPPNSSSSSNLQQLSSFVQQHANSQLQQQSSATVDPTSGLQPSPKPPQPAAPAINTSTAEHNPQPQLQPFFTHHPMNNFLTIHNNSFSPNSAANQFLNQHAAAFANGTPQGAQLRFVSIPFANHPQAQQQLPPSAVPQQQAQPVRTQHHNQYTSQNVLRKTKTTNNSIAPLTPTSSGDTLPGTIQTNGVTPLGIDAFVPTKGKGKGNRKPRINFISVVNGITVGADGIRRKFHCSHCGNGKSFKTKSHLQRHMLTHTGEKPYQCNECGAKFNQSSSLRNHIIAIHTKKFPHTCTICGKGFLMPAVLQKHIQTTGHQSLMPDVSLMDLSPGTSTISQNENNSMMMMGEDGCGGGIVGGSDGGGEDNSNNLNDIITDEDDIEDYDDDNNHEDEDGDDIEEDEEEEDEEEQNDHNFTHNNNNNNLAQLNNSASNLFDGSHNLHHHLLEPHHSHRTDMIAAAKASDMLFLQMNSTNS